MYRLIAVACHLALFMAIVSGAPAGIVCPDAEKRFPAPASEVVEIISAWLTDRGYTVRQDTPRPGTIHVAAWNSQDEWEITVRPQSALASVATIVHEGATPSPEACRRLREFIDGYLLGTSPRPVPRADRQYQPIPTVVLDRIETVVCIRGRARQQEIQFSGFVVDPSGLVLCTAHDLTGHQRVTVTFYDGTSVPGIVARLDLRRDLALVEYSAPLQAYVSLSAGRNLLGMGERVFSIGCPNNLRGTLAAGAISGPPRLVGDQPLWQADMDIYPGSSGSPVFDARGRLVAMVKGRYRGTSTVGFLTPLETIITFLLDDNEP